ncbi:MAG TPA: Flp pilus assembly protein CpaB [Candidatus Acidoferrales bacterium]|nr:Flp pilus assembly protein CpaB [Candidatus Acidoferrales bacterium]
MNRTRLMVGVAVAVVAAFLLSVFVYREFKKASFNRPAPTQYIVVAAVPLQLGTPVDASNLKLIPWPSGQPVAGMFTRIQDCQNRALITPVAANEPILDSKLAPKEAGAGLSATIPQGMRALSVAVNEVVGVAGFVIPGTMVDVLVTGNLPVSQRGGDNNITRTILENVRVLAAGQKIEQDQSGKPQKVPVITLLVSPEDAVKLTMASTEGKIQLALRNTIDTKVTAPAPVLQAVLFAGVPQAPAPVRRVKGKPAPPPPPYVIEVISGDKRQTKSFSD